MSVHQVRIRKDGPVHGVRYEKGSYEERTLCGLALTGLEKVVRRHFSAYIDHPCGRCVVSAAKEAA